MNIISRNNVPNSTLLHAVKRAPETSKAHRIMIRIPEKPENMVKNLWEKACFVRNIHKDVHDHIVDWYLEIINRLHSVYLGSHSLNISMQAPEEKTIIFLGDKTGKSNNFNGISMGIPGTPAGEMRQCFNNVMRKRDYGGDTIAAGRVYISAFTSFIVFVNNLRPGSF
jgi:hypothetical protein